MTHRPELQRSIGAVGFFALAFGSMIGVGWVTALGSWLSQAGPLGAAAAFLAGGLLMMVVGLCYAELTPMLPVAGGEVAYAYLSSGAGRSFLVGWALAFGYFAVCAFEAISVGWVLGLLIPGLDAWPLYSLGGSTVFASHLLLALVLTAAITWVNWVGARWAVRVQTAMTVVFGLITLMLVASGLLLGSTSNLEPLLPPADTASRLGGVLAVLVTAPFWFVGFDTIPQGAEEARGALPVRRLGALILVSIGGAALFYVALIVSVSMAAPWRGLLDAPLPAAAAFESLLGGGALVRLVLLAALLGLLTSWNGFFLAGTRVVFALGRGRLVPPVLGSAHPRHGTPSAAVLVGGVLTLAGACLGRGALLAFVNVGSFCIAVAFLGVTLSFLKLRRTRPDLHRPWRLPAGLLVGRAAATGALLLTGCMLVPGSPAALAWPLEWAILLAVAVLGALLWLGAAGTRAATSTQERARLLLGPAGVSRPRP